MNDSPLNVTVSCFANAKSTEPQPVNLLVWLKTDKYKEPVEVIRATASKEERTKLKLRLPGITPSGQFTKRKADNLIKHSGLLCLDIDHQDNKHIGNFAQLKTELAKIKNFAYIGLSVSGGGYFCLVPIAQPEKHKLHFKALHNQLAKFGIVLDTSGSDVSRLRFASYDSEAYFNHHARVYSNIYKEEEPQPQQSEKHSSDNESEPLDIVVNMVKGARDGEKHHTLYRAARLAGGYIAGKKIDENKAVEALQAAIKAKANVHSIEDAFKTIEDGIAIGKNAPIKKQSAKSAKSAIVPDYEFKPIPQPTPEREEKPLKPARGRLAELEDIFVKNRKLAIDHRQYIVRLLDRCKRESPTKEQIAELERLLIQPESENLQRPKSQPEVLFSRT
jgi:hypothetical protein